MVPIGYHLEVGGTHFFKYFYVPSVTSLSRVEKGDDSPAGKSITLNMPEIDGYTSGVGFGTNLIPFRGWWYPLFQRFLCTFSNKLIARRKGR